MKFVSIVLVFLIACPVIAQDQQDLMDVRVVSIGNDKWLAFTMDDAKKLLQMRLDFPKITLALEKFSESIRIKERIIINQSSVIKNKDKQLGILHKDNERLREEIAAEAKWYKDPWFWFAVGVFIGVGSATAIAVSAK